MVEGSGLWYSSLALQGSQFACSGGMKWEYVWKGQLMIPSAFHSAFEPNYVEGFQMAK